MNIHFSLGALSLHIVNLTRPKDRKLIGDWKVYIVLPSCFFSVTDQRLLCQLVSKHENMPKYILKTFELL